MFEYPTREAGAIARRQPGPTRKLEQTGRVRPVTRKGAGRQRCNLAAVARAYSAPRTRVGFSEGKTGDQRP